MNEEKIKEVFSDEAFVKSLMELETPEEVQTALAEKDVEISVNEIKTLAELIQKKADGTLTDEELEKVAGGSIIYGAFFAGVLILEVVAGAAVITHEATRRRW